MSNFTLPALNACANKAKHMWGSAVDAKAAAGTPHAATKGSIEPTHDLESDLSRHRVGGATASHHFPTLNKEASVSTLSLSRLQAKQRAIEAHSRLDALLRHEGNIRSVILGREYEQRYALQWSYESASAKLRRELETFREKRLMEEKRKYKSTVRLFQASAQLFHDEAAQRELLVHEELAGFSYVESVEDLERLQAEALCLVGEEMRTDAFFEAANEVRQQEMANALLSCRLPKLFVPSEPLHLVSSTVITGKPLDRAAVTRMQYVMDWAVSEEEFRARQDIRYDEMLARMSVVAELNAQRMALEEEPAARAEVVELFMWAACQARLSAVIRIQCWWRLTMAHRWSTRKRGGLLGGLRVMRLQCTSRDLRRKLDRMSKGPTRTLNAKEQLCAVEDAATRLYSMAMDYYLFTLSERIAQFVRGERHDAFLRFHRSLSVLEAFAGNPGSEGLEGQLQMQAVRSAYHCREMSARPDVPHCLPLKVGLPYNKWRTSRWISGSLAYIDSVRHIEADEERARGVICHAEELNSVGLVVLMRAAHAGAEAVNAVEHRLVAFMECEATGRLTVEFQEETGSSTLRAASFHVNLTVGSLRQPFLRLCEAEAAARAAIDSDAQTSWEGITSSEWQWDRLWACRRRLATPYKTHVAWKTAVRTGVARKFVSLNSAACVVTRFMRGARRTRMSECNNRALTPPREVHLTDLSEVLMAQLARLLDEKEERRERKERDRDGDHTDAQFLRRERKATPVKRTSKVASNTVKERLDNIVALAASRALRKQPPSADPRDALQVACNRYNAWLTLEELKPREVHYKELLTRFHCANADLYHAMNHLLLLYREGRHKIEREETLGRHYMQNHRSFRITVIDALEYSEGRRRVFLEAEEEDARSGLLVDLWFMKGIIHWARASGELRSCSGTQLGRLFVPRHLGPASPSAEKGGRATHSAEKNHRSTAGLPFT